MLVRKAPAIRRCGAAGGGWAGSELRMPLSRGTAPRSVWGGASAAAETAASDRPRIAEQVSSQQVPVYVAAVNLLMADGAVAEARRGQIVERRRHHARHDGRFVPGTGRLAWHSRQTSRTSWRISIFAFAEPCGIVAALAAFLPHRSVLESERSALVAVAFEAAGLIGARHLHQAGFEAAVRIMAIDAASWRFRERGV